MTGNVRILHQPRKLKKYLTEYIRVLRLSEWRLDLQKNLMSGRIERGNREFNDVDFVDLLLWFEANYGVKVSAADAKHVICKIAEENHYDPLVVYFNNLPKWDRVPRVRRWLIDYLGAEGPQQYLEEVGTSVLVSAAARAMIPGCKVDTMMVLRGPQGGKKSTAVRALAPETKFFSDYMPDIRDKDCEIQLGNTWIQEVSELSSFRRADIESLKAFITRTEAMVRRPYAVNPELVQRRCIFIGTTNSDSYLTDDTGNRRFLPVDVGEILPLAIEIDRDQLWAEAFILLYDKVSWQIRDRFALDHLSTMQGRVKDEDSWTDAIRFAIDKGRGVREHDGRRYTTISLVLEVIIQVPTHQNTRVHQMRVASVLRSMGSYKGERLRESITYGGSLVVPWWLPPSISE